MKFCQLLETALQNNNMKQKELANLIGISPKTVSSYVRGKTEPDFETLIKLCSILQIDLNKIINITQLFPGLYITSKIEIDTILKLREIPSFLRTSIFEIIQSISIGDNDE